MPNTYIAPDEQESEYSPDDEIMRIAQQHFAHERMLEREREAARMRASLGGVTYSTREALERGTVEMEYTSVSMIDSPADTFSHTLEESYQKIVTISEYRNEFRVGDKVKFYDSSASNGYVEGVIGDINSGYFFIFNNKNPGSQGVRDSRDYGYRYSWSVSFQDPRPIQITPGDGTLKVYVDPELETDPLYQAELLYRRVKPEVERSLESEAFDMFDIEIGDVVQVIQGSELVRNTEYGSALWRGVVHGSARGTSGKLYIKMLDKKEIYIPSRLHNFFKVASAWPSEKSLTQAVNIMPVKKQEKADFYDLFQIGLEIEGEFINGQDDIESLTDEYFSESNGTLKEDGSLYRRRDGYMLELNSPILQTVGDEGEFLGALTNISTEKKRKNGVHHVFSTVNETAGTHIHLDFNFRGLKRFMDEKLRAGKPHAAMNYSEYLRFFDSVAFEKYFFDRYFATFHLRKFWVRLTNDYCRSFLTPEEKGVKEAKLTDVEQAKYNRGKYSWLNYESLRGNMGIEFRIFPYITTVEGTKEIIHFIQRTVMSFFLEHVSSEDIEIINQYYIGELQRVDTKKWNVRERKKYNDLFVSGRSKHKYSLDVMRFLSKMLEKHGPLEAESPQKVLFKRYSSDNGYTEVPF